MRKSGMDASLYQNIRTNGALLNLSARAKWRLSGTDRVRYLNGQVTHDVRTVSSDKALHACVTNVKGRIEGDLFIHSEDDSLVFDAPADLREALGARLERYIIADDALLEDITDERQLWHCIGGASSPALNGGEALFRLENPRFGLQGYDVWLPLEAAIASPGIPILSEEDAESLRILQGIPGWPHELNPGVFPPEAGLDKTAMSFSKGCYIGQEVLSRIKTTGKMPCELAGWQAVEGDEYLMTPGATLHSEREIGHITSVTRHPVTGRLTGLALIRQGAAALDSRLLVRNGLSSIAAEVKISALPNQ